jgi:hypothetical protein
MVARPVKKLLAFYGTEVHYSVHKSPPPILIMNQTNSLFHAISSEFLKIDINIVLQSTLRSSELCYINFESPMSATCPAHLFRLD